jgi:hypothetical protein
VNKVLSVNEETEPQAYWVFPLTSLRYRRASSAAGHILGPSGLPLVYGNFKVDRSDSDSLNELLLRQLLLSGNYIYVDPEGTRRRLPIALYNQDLDIVLYVVRKHIQVKKMTTTPPNPNGSLFIL